MKLVDLSNYQSVPLSRRIYAVCWLPFEAIFNLPRWILRKIGQMFESAGWFISEYPAFGLTFGLGGLFFSVATIAGDASVSLFVGTLFLAGISGLALSILVGLLKLIFD